MNKELRRVSVLVLAMFLALFSSTTVIQVVQQQSLQADSRNVRTLYASFSAERGPIIAGDTTIAMSEASGDEYKYLRVYPEGELYAPVTGYFTLNGENTGIEGSLNDYLSGRANEQFLDQLNAILTGQHPKGAAVEVTVDPVVQQAAWDALGDLKGAIVAIEPSSGRILAMVSKPSYDPNLLAGHSQSEVLANYDALLSDADAPLINRSIRGDLNPPGSTFKLVMTSAALMTGEYTPDSTVPNPSSLQLPGTETTISNQSRGTCGSGSEVTIATALRLSCNIPFAELGAELGYDVIHDQARAFGFEDPELGVPMKVQPSVFPEPESEAQLMLQSFGQGDNRAQPLQMAMVSAAIANDGELMRPNLVERITAPDLSVLQDFEPTVYSQPITSDVAETMTQLMVSNVAAGAASGARIEGVDVAGKTGTAENGDDDPFTLWFTGFAPATDPQVAVAVVLEDGAGRGQSGSGNGIAAPIAKKVMEAVLNR
ncbi:penicillin-binding protein 2 [Homoserinibacter sp. GY 40078]|uniref:peptidoglycan D,D-transpeptidase FtsI family protein n=1 Tax=Homoserinibacter sp. GY 40078 TaxID=2603275 RepID=UPI0011C9AB77|nr:penicillin-binding transpeptidase domain-containing protein [Homoserinibacter sp. GY 40078]TXK18886.1 penicillin-binding protein 2 [Homoserinibacter sp. GY 40078]